MESEALQNSLSKDKTIEQLRTTVDKLETVIEQLNSTSVVDLPSSNSVNALITTTEELENVVANLPPETMDSEKPENAIAANLSSETVEPESEITTISNEVTEGTPEVIPPTSQEKLSELEPEVAESEPSESDKTIQQTSVAATPQETTVKSQKPVAKTKKTASTKPTKSKKKKNWIAVAIVALIIAIISSKYLVPGLISQLSSPKGAEIPIETAPLIATDAKNNSLQKSDDIEKITDQQEDILISETPENQINNIAIIDNSEQIIKSEITEVNSIDLIPEITTNPDLKEYFIEEENKSVIATKSDLETPLANNELEKAIALDVTEVAEIEESEVKTLSELPLDTEKIAEQRLDEAIDLEVDNIPESILEPEPKILVPENLVADEMEQELELKTVIHDVELTPEQNLIAALSAKVLQLAEDYKEDIVLSIEPNIPNNVLIVRVTDDWYQLENTEQDEIVATMFTRSQDLEFRRLEITDQNDNLVARSPVIGQNMIIFRRASQILASEV